MKPADKHQQMEKWLEKETKKGNQLTEMYSALLKNAHPEVRAHYYEVLHDMMEGMKSAADEARRTS